MDMKQDRMPVLFVGHGNPMNAIEENDFSRRWRGLASELPRPTAILCISAHWETEGTQVTAMETPPTIHDFGGFPKALYAAQYPAPGSPALAGQMRDAVKKTAVGLDMEWGLDHGCWSVLKQMYPKADLPVVQLSLDRTQPARYHYALAKELPRSGTRGCSSSAAATWCTICGGSSMRETDPTLSRPLSDSIGPWKPTPFSRSSLTRTGTKSSLTTGPLGPPSSWRSRHPNITCRCSTPSP